MSDNPEQIETEAREHRQALREDLDAIFERLSPGQIMDEALGQFGGVKSLTQNLGAQVRDNPLPVIVTAAGLAWLASATRSGKGGGGTSLEMHAGPAPETSSAVGHVGVDPDDYDADFAARRVEIAEAGCVRLESESDEDYQNRLARTRADALELDRAEGETDLGFRERVSDTANTAREKARDARRRINDGAAKARKGLAGAAGSAKHGAQSAAGSVKHGAQKASGATADAARSGVNSAASLHENSPLATGAIALAAGALIGALLPLTRTEHDTLKRPADEAGKAAAGAASKAAEQAREARDKVQEKHAEQAGGDTVSGEASNGDGRTTPPGERAAPPPPPSTH
ncbi:MAG: DUF3618 domain-containing protein [Oceanicaulis sp.]